MTDAKKVIVVLVCTTADEDEVDDIADGVRAIGREVALIAGVDARARVVIGQAIERCGELGLIVACTSAALDGPLLRKVEGLFSARRGPNHAMVRVALGRPINANVSAISRAFEGFVSSQGRVVRRGTGEGPKLREVVAVNDDDIAPGERELRVPRPPAGRLPRDPKSVELSRRRRAARQRERPGLADDESARLGPSLEASQAVLHSDEQRLDRVMIALVVGAGIIAVLVVLVVLSFSG